VITQPIGIGFESDHNNSNDKAALIEIATRTFEMPLTCKISRYITEEHDQDRTVTTDHVLADILIVRRRRLGTIRTQLQHL
jgi:hypothetical protein